MPARYFFKKKGFRWINIHSSVLLMLILNQKCHVGSKYLTESTEFGCSLVLQAIFEGTLGSLLIQRLQFSVVLQQIKNVSIIFPQEFEAGNNFQSIISILNRLASNGLQHTIFHVRGFRRWFVFRIRWDSHFFRQIFSLSEQMSYRNFKRIQVVSTSSGTPEYKYEWQFNRKAKMENRSLQTK